MTPNPSHTTTGREGESSARIINGMEKRKIHNREKLFRKATPTSNELQQYSGGIPIQDHPVTSQRRSLLLILYMLCGQYMAVSMPGHGDLTALLMSRMASSLTLWVPTV